MHDSPASPALSSESWPPVIALVGPTAAGKSALALQLARTFPADVVTADSRQVYRYMDIGTAKPSPAEQAAVRHYLLDLIEPVESYSVQRYVDEGSRVLRRIAAQGRIALVVGGTGFYVRGLLDRPILPAVPPDQELRRRLYQQAERDGAASLHARLAERDQASARRIHPHNLPRLIRALEIVEHSGGPVPQPLLESAIPALYLGLSMPRPVLREVSDQRVLAQIKAGLAEETRLLLDMGYSPNLPPLQGFAYAQMVDYLQGRLSLPDAITAYQDATHRFIRRQMTWFRADHRINWITAGPGAAAEATEQIRRWLTTASYPLP